MGVTPLRLIDVIEQPLVDFRQQRQDLVERMAKDLIKYEAFVNEQDAIRSLFGRGYSIAEIMILVGDARVLAFQEIIAAEMSKP